MSSNAALFSRLATSGSPASAPSAASWSQLSGGSGESGGVGSNISGKLFKVFATDDSGSQGRCRYQVRKDSGRVCVEESKEGAETCGTRHQGDFTPLQPNTFYLLHTVGPKAVIFEEPSFSFEFVGPTYQSVIKSSSYSMEDFTELSVLIKSLGDNDGNFITQNDLIRKRQEVKGPLKTPANMKKKRVTNADGTSRVLFDDSPQPPTIDVDELRGDIKEADWIANGAPEGFVEHVRAIREVTLNTAEFIPGMFRDLSALHELTTQDVSALGTRCELLEAVNRSERPDVSMDLSSDVAARLGVVEETLGNTSSREEEVHKLRSEVDAHEKRIAELEVQLNGVLLALIDIKNDATASNPPRVDFKPNVMSAAVDDRLDILQKQVENLTNVQGLSSDTVTVFNDLISGIRSVDDVRAWLIRHFFDDTEGTGDNGDAGGDDGIAGESLPQADVSEMSFGAFSDVFVTIAIAEDLESQSTKGETLKEMEAYDKAGLSHPGEATVAYALRQSSPPLFTKGTGTTSNKTYLKALKTPEEWDRMAGGHIFPGLKQRIESNTEAIKSEVTSNIAESLNGRLRVTALAKAMLAASLEFLKLLCDWMTETYKELTDISKFPKAEAWLLVTQIVARIFRDLNNAKGGVRTVHPKSSALVNTSKALYAMLRVHEVMHEYQTLDIKNHPAVSSEYVKFLATHVGFNDAKTIQDSVKTLGTKLSTVETSAKAAKSTATEALEIARFCKTKGGW